MKKLLTLTITLLIIVSLWGCSSESKEHVGEAKSPSGSSAQQGRNYSDVIEDFEESGFTNIKLNMLDDLVTGWMTEDGEVESVSIDGDEDYSPDEWYPNDVEVIISYHTFPVAEEEDDIEDIEDIENIDRNTDEDETKQNETKQDENKNKVITASNNDELATILSLKDEFSQEYVDFAEIYKNKVIEFDACITYIVNHENYKTRYDLLVSAGDYVDENTANPGPIFKLEDVNTNDLGIKDLYLPDFVNIGHNITLKARVDKFDENSGLFYLKPILVTER